MSYDLILQTYAGQHIASRNLNQIRLDIQRSAALGRLCEITLASLAPGQVDVLVLGEGLNLGDFREHEFVEFCRSRGLPADRENEGTAAAFVRSRYGSLIATFKLPTHDEDARTAYSEIVQLAGRHGLRVTDSQKGADVDLKRPGSLPPMWST